jgi:hypothetical protein
LLAQHAACARRDGPVTCAVFICLSGGRWHAYSGQPVKNVRLSLQATRSTRSTCSGSARPTRCNAPTLLALLLPPRAQRSSPRRGSPRHDAPRGRGAWVGARGRSFGASPVSGGIGVGRSMVASPWPRWTQTRGREDGC